MATMRELINYLNGLEKRLVATWHGDQSRDCVDGNCISKTTAKSVLLEKQHLDWSLDY